jgi:hypothetical protein
MIEQDYFVNLNSYKLSFLFLILICLYFIFIAVLNKIKIIIPLDCVFIFDNLIQQISISGSIIIIFHVINYEFDNYLEKEYGNSFQVLQSFIILNIFSFILQGISLFLYIISESSRIKKKSSISFSKTLLLIYNSQENQFSYKEIKSLIEFKIISDYFISIKKLPREFNFDHYYSIVYKKYLKQISNYHIFSGLTFAITCVVIFIVNNFFKNNNIYELYCKDSNFSEDSKLCNESILLFHSIVLLIMSTFLTCIFFSGIKCIKNQIENAFQYKDIRYNNSTIISSIEEQYSYERYLECLVKEENEKSYENNQIERRIENLIYIQKLEEDLFNEEKDFIILRYMRSFFCFDHISLYFRLVEVSIYSITFYCTIYFQQVIWLSIESKNKYWYIFMIPAILIYNLYILRKILQRSCLLATFHRYDKEVASFVSSNYIEKKLAEKIMIESATRSLRKNSLTQDYILNLVDCIDIWKTGRLNERQLLIFLEAIDVFLNEVIVSTVFNNLDFQQNGSILFADLIDLFLPYYDLEET